MRNQIKSLSAELNNLFTCKKEREELVRQHGTGSVWFEQLKQLVEMIEDCKAEIKAVVTNNKQEQEAVEINVYFEEGYRWSVDINGGESIDSNISKADAMAIARSLKKQYPNAVINEQKLTRAERKRNISNLHENSFVYDRSL